MFEISAMPELLMKFSGHLRNAMVDYVTVHYDRAVVFSFKERWGNYEEYLKICR